MKKNIQLAVSLLCLALVGASCEKHDPEFFDEGANGAYFDYATAAEYDKTLNFSDHIVGHPDTVALMLRVKLLGYLMEEGRTLAVKTRPIEGYELADVIIDEVVFSNKEYEKDIEVKIVRPELEDVLYGVCVYLDGSGDIGLGINGKEEVQVFVTESYEKPVVWYSHMESLLGAWSREKHIFLARHTKDNHFYEKLYKDGPEGHLFDDILALNVSAVNALLAEKGSIDGEAKDSITLAVDFPILQRDYNPAYTEPYFWNNLKEELGNFKAEKLTRLGGRLGGTSVKELMELCEAYDGANGELKTALKALNKELVPEMLDEYNRNAQNGLTLADYDPQSIVKLGTADYTNVNQPFWWEDPKGLGTADVVKRYFGAYERKKYLFMIKEVAKVEDADTFIAASLFPFVYDVEAGTYSWDTTPVGPNQLAGEERIKECYRIIKAANDKRYSKYDIPEVEL